jgi:hypothetical protein
MKALFNGQVGGSIQFQKGANYSGIPITILTDAGAIQALSTGTVDLVVYDTSDRRNAALKTVSVTVTTATDGKCTLALVPANLDFGPGTYFGFVRFTDATSKVFFSRQFTLVNIG